MYKKLKITLTVLSYSFVLIGCKCDNYFSNSGNKTLESRLFTVECHILPSVIKEEMDIMEVWIDFKDQQNQKVVRGTLQVYPLIGSKDTLKFKSKYASVYSFNFDENCNVEMNLIINYDEEFNGRIVHKEETFSNLKKIKLCRFRPVLH
jgi:hypothetical protein